MPRKRTLFAILIALGLLVFAGYATRGPIGSTFFEWYLKGYCRACLSSRLTFKDLRHENDQWVFDRPVLTSKKRLEEGGYRIQADRATLNLSMAWLKRSFDFSVEIENPHVDIGKGAEEFRKLVYPPPQTFHLFEVHTKLHVPHGTIFVHDFAEDHLVPVPLFFHVNLACKESRQGCAAFWIGEQKKENEGFLVSFLENEAHEPQILFELQNLCCATTQQILKGIWPDYQSLTIVDGNLNGNIALIYPEDSSVYAKGQISLKELVLHHADMDLKIVVPEASLKLMPKEIEKDGKKSLKTIGKFNILPSKVDLVKEGQPFWALHEVKGSASFDLDYENFSLTGFVEEHGKYRNFDISGIGASSEEGQTVYAVDMVLKGEDPNDDTNFHFSARKLSDQWSFGEVELLGFGVEELDLAQHLIRKNYPEWSHIHLHQGNFDAAMLVYLKGFQLSEVNVERIAVHDLSFSFEPWGLNASVENALGSLSFDLLADDPLKTLNADLKILQGKLNLETAVEDNISWQLSGIDSHLKVDKGVFQKSLLEGTIAGLQGEVLLDGTSTGPLIQFNFYGGVKDFAQALPDPMRKGLDKKFIDDDLKIFGIANRTLEGLIFNGQLSIETKNQPKDIHFGFILGRSSEGLWRRWPPPPLAMDYYLKAGFEAIHTLTPPLALPLYSAYQYLISQNLGFSGFSLKEGWFRAEKLPLDKYVSPFLFRNNQMDLEGLGDFSGVFDQQKIVVNYDIQDMVLENSDFAIEIKSLSDEGTLPKKLVGNFMYDFDKKTSFNAFPIRKATYFEKNSGLLYTEIDANLSMEDFAAYFDNLTAFCNGLYFAGSAVVDWSMPGDGVFVVDMQAHEMHGKISQLQHLLSHLNKSLAFLKIPIEGNVGLHKKGGHLNFSFNKDGYELEALIQGTMTDGKMADQNTDLSLQELSLNFDYDHQGKKLAFTDVQGTLLVGKPSHVEEYTVSGEGVRFTDYSKNEAKFDIWVGDKTRDILRLAGKTRSETDGYGNPYTNILFNRSLTHFGDVHPAEIKLAFKDWSQLELFHLKFEFQLDDLLADLQRFSRTGFFFLSRGLLKELNDLETAKGAIKADLNYDTERSMLHYRIDGEDLSFGNRTFANFLLSGTKKGSLWSVNQMQIDDISLAFDVLKEGPFWNINFLGARLGNYLLVGMEGQYSDDDSHLEARINLLEADLTQMDHWPSLGSSFKSNLIGGQIRAAGTLHAEFDKAMPYGMHLNLQMNGTLTHGKLKNIFFEDIKNLSIKYDTSSGLTIANAAIGIKSLDDMVKAKVFLKEVGFNTMNHDLLVDGLHFDIPSKNLPWVVQKLRDNFPDKITDQIADGIRSSKTQGSLQGILRYSSSKPYSSLRLHLNDGIYHFKGKEHDLSGFVLDYDPFALKVFTEYRFQNHRLRLDAHSSVSGYDAGEMILSDFSGGNIPNSLKIHWRIHPQTGFYIQKMFGNLSGMAFDFICDPTKKLSDESMHLVGKLDINFRKATGIMDDEIAAKIANMELGEGYSLAGQWSLLKGKSKTLADSVFFQGELTGRDFEFFGYRFYNLSSQFTYSPEIAYMRNLAVVDSCGSVQIGQIDFFHRGNGFWQMVAPLITISEFRPSLLNSTKSVHHSTKSLVVRNLDINNVNGILGDRNTFTGSGQLTFANPPKKNFQHSILAIPAELLTRIGLDMAVLTPVRGTVIFDIKDGKAVLKRFKDVYSKGRLSKFYLANNGSSSYVDFDGNLNLQVRMKQYNLIFKLAELLTVNVQGTLRKPTYALQTQQKQEE